MKVHNDNEDQPLNGGLVDFQGCRFKQGTSLEMLMAADAEMSAFMTKIKQHGKIYRWFPMNGVPSDGRDFLQLTWNDNASDRGTDIVRFLANGGLNLAKSLYSNIVMCESGPTMLHSPLGGKQ